MRMEQDSGRLVSAGLSDGQRHSVCPSRVPSTADTTTGRLFATSVGGGNFWGNNFYSDFLSLTLPSLPRNGLW